jgi:hypothetical protein
MADPQQEAASNEIIVKGFLDTLLPFFSWCVSQLSVALFGCNLVVVFRNPTKGYVRQMIDSWVGGNSLFSCAEILSFQTASGRHRARKKLKKILAPFFRELRRKPEWIRLRRAVLGKLQAQMPDKSATLPRRMRLELDLGEIEERRIMDFSSYSRGDILDKFPIDTIVKDGFASRINLEVGDYAETVRTLW